jgi:hypothetical protein
MKPTVTLFTAVLLGLATLANAEEMPAAAPNLNRQQAGRIGAATTKYPLSGYWLYGRPDEAAWQITLERISRLGADTVIQFGSRPMLKTAEQIRTHPLISQCRFDGGTGNPPRRIYLFETQEDFGAALLALSGVDQRIELGEQIVWRLVFPATDLTKSATASAERPTYDLFYITGRKKDSVRDLLAVAKAHSCRVFIGMPCATPDPQYPWDPDVGSLSALEELTRRVLKDYAERHGSQPAFAGLYQSLETPVSKTCLTKVLAVYRLQHAVVRAILPGKQILISPYWDARKKNPNGTDIAGIKAGIRLLAQQNVDIIAPQDSRGTGKVGLFWPHQTSEPVDARLEPAVGKLTYGEAYVGNTTDFYRAARESLDDVASREGLRVALWANIEAFEPSPSGDSSTGIRRTQQERLEQAIMFASIYPSHLVSFMWDDFFTSRAEQTQSLGEEIGSVARRPLIVNVQFNRFGSGPNLVVWGYDLEGAEAEISFKDSSGRTKNLKAALTELPAAARKSIAHPLPVRLQSAGLAFDLDQPARGSSIAISATRQELRCFHPYMFQAD